MNLNLRSAFLIALAALLVWPASITVADPPAPPAPASVALCVWHDPALAAFGADGALFQAVQTDATVVLHQIPTQANELVPACNATDPHPCQAELAAGYAVLATQLLCFTPTATSDAPGAMQTVCGLDGDLEASEQCVSEGLTRSFNVVNPPCRPVSRCEPTLCINAFDGATCTVGNPCDTPLGTRKGISNVCQLTPCSLNQDQRWQDLRCLPKVCNGDVLSCIPPPPCHLKTDCIPPLCAGTAPDCACGIASIPVLCSPVPAICQQGAPQCLCAGALQVLCTQLNPCPDGLGACAPCNPGIIGLPGSAGKPSCVPNVCPTGVGGCLPCNPGVLGLPGSAGKPACIGSCNSDELGFSLFGEQACTPKPVACGDGKVGERLGVAEACAGTCSGADQIGVDVNTLAVCVDGPCPGDLNSCTELDECMLPVALSQTAPVCQIANETLSPGIGTGVNARAGCYGTDIGWWHAHARCDYDCGGNNWHTIVGLGTGPTWGGNACGNVACLPSGPTGCLGAGYGTQTGKGQCETWTYSATVAWTYVGCLSFMCTEQCYGTGLPPSIGSDSAPDPKILPLDGELDFAAVKPGDIVCRTSILTDECVAVGADSVNMFLKMGTLEVVRCQEGTCMSE